MTKDEYMKFHQDACNKLMSITKAKNADYTGTNPDPFANFKIVEANGICTTEQGFLTRMSDKMARITSFSQKGELQVRDESVTDTLLDLANYCILLAGYIESKRPKPKLNLTPAQVTGIIAEAKKPMTSSIATPLQGATIGTGTLPFPYLSEMVWNEATQTYIRKPRN